MKAPRQPARRPPDPLPGGGRRRGRRRRFGASHRTVAAHHRPNAHRDEHCHDRGRDRPCYVGMLGESWNARRDSVSRPAYPVHAPRRLARAGRRFRRQRRRRCPDGRQAREPLLDWIDGLERGGRKGLFLEWKEGLDPDGGQRERGGRSGDGRHTPRKGRRSLMRLGFEPRRRRLVARGCLRVHR
jgi:hypothetical protein